MKPVVSPVATNRLVALKLETRQIPHHLIDPIFTEALLRISAYLPEWEVELVNDSETWLDYIAAIVPLPVRHICGVMLKKKGMCKFMSVWVSEAIKDLDILLSPDFDVNPFVNDGQVSHTQIMVVLQLKKPLHES